MFLASGAAAAARSGFAKQKHVEPGQSTARSMGKLFSDANQSCASFSSRPTHWRPPVRNIVASLAWSASRCSLFLPVRRPRLFCRRQRGNANPGHRHQEEQKGFGLSALLCCDRGSNPWAGAFRKQSCGLFLATGVAAATRSGFAKQKHVEPGQSTARSMGKLFSDANQSCASFSSRPTHWRPPVRNIVASLAWSASRCSLFLPVRRPRLFCRRQRGNANPKKSQNIALFRLGNG